jgi:hypothetical protein
MAVTPRSGVRLCCYAPELFDQHPNVLRIIHRYDDKLHVAGLECRFQCGRQAVGSVTIRPRHRRISRRR